MKIFDVAKFGKSVVIMGNVVKIHYYMNYEVIKFFFFSPYFMKNIITTARHAYKVRAVLGVLDLDDDVDTT